MRYFKGSQAIFGIGQGLSPVDNCTSLDISDILEYLLTHRRRARGGEESEGEQKPFSRKRYFQLENSRIARNGGTALPAKVEVRRRPEGAAG
jgi:hypothetical protein